MAKEISVAVEIEDTHLAREFLAALKKISDVRATQWLDAVGEKGSVATKATPDIIIIDEQPESDAVFRRLSLFNQNFPDAAIFVVSEDKRPKHIVDVMKAGADEYLVSPFNQEVLVNAIEEIRTKMATSGKIARGSIYSFISSKGGLGSTVIAVNAAVAMTLEKNGAVALCDMSFQSGDSSVLLDIVPENSFEDICDNFHRLDVSLLRGCMHRHTSGLEVLAAPLNPEESEEIHSDHIRKTFDLIKKLYDNIFVDCTSMFVNDCSMEAFNESEKVFIVTDLSVPAIRNAARLFKTIVKLGVPAKKVEFIVNRFIKGGPLSIDEVEKTLGKRVFWLFPNDFADIVHSINRGVPLIKDHPHAPFAKTVMDFVNRLRYPTADENYRGIRGAFGKAI